MFKSSVIRNIGIAAKSKHPLLSGRRHKAAYEGEGKTTVRVINQEQDTGLMIDSFATYGFRLNNGVTVLGPMAIFPRTVLSWQVTEADAVTEESLRLFKLLEPSIDLLIVGLESGDRGKFAGVFRAARANGLNAEILPTEHACATFNFLSAEGRAVAAALLPPLSVHMDDDDRLEARMHYDDVFHSSLDR